jgi:hypothetical protein
MFVINIWHRVLPAQDFDNFMLFLVTCHAIGFLCGIRFHGRVWFRLHVYLGCNTLTFTLLPPFANCAIWLVLVHRYSIFCVNALPLQLFVNSIGSLLILCMCAGFYYKCLLLCWLPYRHSCSLLWTGLVLLVQHVNNLLLSFLFLVLLGPFLSISYGLMGHIWHLWIGVGWALLWKCLGSLHFCSSRYPYMFILPKRQRCVASP